MLLHRGRESQRLLAELEFHVEQQTAENIAAGMSPEEARYAALRAFGNPTLLRERARENWNWHMVESLLRDIRYGVRTLGRSPGFTLIAIIVLALGIGSTVALFTVVNSVLLKPLPLPEPDRVMAIHEADTIAKVDNNSVAGGTFESWRDGNKSFEKIAIATQMDVNLSASNGQLPERVQGVISTAEALPLLGVRPVYGRLFNATDDSYGANGTVLVSWGFWKRRFGGDPGAVGRTILLDAKPHTIIGVLPAWFTYPDQRVQLWTTVYFWAAPETMHSHDSHNFAVIGRLKQGVSAAAAQADLSSISLSERKLHPDGPVFNAASVRPLLESETRDVKTVLYALFAATGCLLLIACLNIANLLVARAATRRRELAIRTALGGSRGRLIREQLVEALLLSFAGTALGLLLAQGALMWLVHLRSDLPRVDAIHLDLYAILFSVGLAVICGVVAGLAPALIEDEAQVVRALQESSRAVSGGHRSVHLRRALLSVEVALTVVLLVGAGLFLRSYQKLCETSIGVPTDHVLTMTLSLPDMSYRGPAKKVAFEETLIDRIRVLPGVRAVSVTTLLPGADNGEDDAITIHEDPPLKQGDWLDASVRFVDPGYFESMKLPILKGRSFSPDERLGHNKYAIVSESFVREIMHGRQPLGKHVDDANNNQPGEKGEASNEIIGVVGNVREVPGETGRPTVYFPLYGGLHGYVQLAVHTEGDPLQMAIPVQKTVAALDSNLPVSDVLSYDQLIGKNNVSESFDATLLSIFAVLSLVLAAVGLFGVLSYIVAQRTGEIGVRIALGAQREQVLRLMLVDGMKPALFGLVLGLIGSIATTRLIQSLLYGTKALDPVVFATVAAALLAVAGLACLVPAWRASRLDPMQALRTE
ncbi:ADOP family duplicated permease [Silvibacterium acidisoli]|uniref:ADOP family duplicated permease n=1 Tax=Acidobacteriaceae bacterium ZG23-2 TaxID=2883246 RepID=UPI00406D3D15